MNFKDVYVDKLDALVEAPIDWSVIAINIFADKYLAPQDKNSIPAALRRVALFVSNGDKAVCESIYAGLLEQRFAFNSPVFFNAGVEEDPQCSACFIQSVEDNMDSILDLAKKEGMLFKYGSGTGTNLSPLRGSQEQLTCGGIASGPVSFMKAYDALAGVIKSGGKTRRAAKMQLLDVDHPDISDFIWCKAREERKAKDLIQKAGYEASFDGDAYSSVFFQNANLSVRVTDLFMDAAARGHEYALTARTSGLPVTSVHAPDLLQEIADASWECGDPGIQFADTINKWHTCPHAGPINASNPCSEFVFLDETSCNLASLNLVKYLDDDGNFDVNQFKFDVGLLIVAMDNIVDLAGYPTEEIAEKTRKFRPLGLGYTNLGGLLIKKGLRYDTQEARRYAASITALMTGEAYRMSAKQAKRNKSYPGIDRDRHLEIVSMHHQCIQDWARGDIWDAASEAFVQARYLGRSYGFRNAQVTVLAPTGTISLTMGCTTTGIEPLYARAASKKLTNGDTISVGYSGPSNSVVVASEVSPEDHVRMVAAVQPFLSGAVSKTVNMPESASVEDVEDVIRLAHKTGVKAIAIYRDGSKLLQPMNDNDKTSSATEDEVQLASVRQSLPDERQAITHKFSVAGYDGYVTVGLYEDRRPGEVFVKIAKEGSTISGLLDAWAVTVSIALQHGVPMRAITDKLAFTRFEPSGMTGNTDIPIAHSIVDYLCRWMESRFLPTISRGKLKYADTFDNHSDRLDDLIFDQLDQPTTGEATCPECGHTMLRTGTCHTCPVCGHNGGCG